jgi:hypothetical protein
MSTGVKVHFQLEQDEDGYPPIAVESVWAKKDVGKNEFVLDNVPFFVRTATLGDTITAIPDDQGTLWFQGMARRSTNSLVRVVFFEPSAMDSVGEKLISLGCAIEYLRIHNLLAASIPSFKVFTDVQHYLASEAEKGTIDYEEAIIRQ